MSKIIGIDLNRENIKGFDVRELYVGIVSDLKERGFWYKSGTYKRINENKREKTKI